MDQKRNPGTGSKVWQAFALRHKGNPILNLDPLYSLPEPLIDIISGKQGGRTQVERQGIAPGFLSDAEVEFERDLARTASGGFIFRRPFDCLLLAKADPEVDKANQKIKSAIADTFKREGLHSQRIQNMFDAEARYMNLVRQRAVAYAGWLATSAKFRSELDALRQEFDHYIVDKQQFPRLRESFFEELLDPPDRSTKENALIEHFYRRWNLRCFLTWDIPVPIRPMIHEVHSDDRMGLLSEAGINIFLPWYLLRDGRIQLKELARQLKDHRNPAHLAGWLNTDTAKKEKLGDTRFANLFVLYRYQTLAIGPRYGNRAGWENERQDEAFARYLSLSVESVRRLRLTLQKRPHR